MKPLEQLLRPNIRTLSPYSCARNEYSGQGATVFLDANENPYNSPYNRYPDPLQRDLKKILSKYKRVRPEQICLGNGSDEIIDLCFRSFCRPGIDNVVAIEPTYGMYKVCADINDVEYRPVELDCNYQTSARKLLDSCDENTKLIWICSPNNPTGNCMDHGEMDEVLHSFEGIVVVDEAYSDFSCNKPFRHRLNDYPNLIVLNTMSKAWACAGLRLGMAFAHPGIIDVFNKVKYPYNISLLTQQQAMEAFKHVMDVEKWVHMILEERSRVMEAFSLLPICVRIYPTDANFFLAKVTDAQGIYDYLVEKGIIVRNRTRVTLCQNCLRITIGSKTENNLLMAALRQYKD